MSLLYTNSVYKVWIFQKNLRICGFSAWGARFLRHETARPVAKTAENLYNINQPCMEQYRKGGGNMDYYKAALELHEQHKGKIEVTAKVPVKTRDDLSAAYTPGVAEPCREIAKDPAAAYTYTAKGNLVAVVTNGTAVLGLGDIGAAAAMPVMEGKAILFKEFGGVDAFPICLDTKDPEQVIEAVRLLVNGPGAAGTAIIKMLLAAGVRDVIACDENGILYKERGVGIVDHKEMLCGITNKSGMRGTLADAVKGADVFIGVSVGGALKPEMARTMARDAIVFAMANPVPEITPEEARAAGVRVMGTGRSDYPNQINNVLAFPGVFKGALSVRARDINSAMKVAAAHAIADLVSDEERNEDYIIPGAFDARVAQAVADAVARAARESGVARL